MNLTRYTNLLNKILLEPTERFCEIYKITNTINGKTYVGQTVSHVLKAGKYRPYGSIKRFNSHISEALSEKKHQCHYLNNAIRKYGKENFCVELIEYCETENADERETFYTLQLNTLFPNGYNLKLGGFVFTHSDESKRRLSVGVANYYKDKKFERFKDVTNIGDNIEKYIFPLKREGKQYGWYVLIKSKKADFGGIHMKLDDSYERAKQFINELKNNIAQK